jgi:hypothetical protein
MTKEVVPGQFVRPAERNPAALSWMGYRSKSWGDIQTD